MAKKNNSPTKEVSEMEKSDIVLSEKKTKKLSKEEKVKAKETEKKAKETAKKKKAEKKPKKNIIKSTFSELKKVSWPSFKQACKQTGSVLVVVAVFMIVVLGMDLLLSWLTSLIA